MWVGWKVHRLTMMQWSNLTKHSLFFNIVSCAVHTLLPSVLQRLDAHGVKLSSWSSKKILNCSVFSCWGTENNQMVQNQENMEGDQPIQSHSHAQQPLQPQTCVQEHCPGETGLPSSVFQAVHEMSKVLSYLSSVGLSGR